MHKSWWCFAFVDLGPAGSTRRRMSGANPGTESHLPWPPPNLITHAHFSIISTAASAPHSKPAWGLIGCKINPEGKEKDKVGGSFLSTLRAVTCNRCCWHLLWGIILFGWQRFCTMMSQAWLCLTPNHHLKALYRCISSLSSQTWTFFYFHTKCTTPIKTEDIFQDLWHCRNWFSSPHPISLLCVLEMGQNL